MSRYCTHTNDSTICRDCLGVRHEPDPRILDLTAQLTAMTEECKDQGRLKAALYRVNRELERQLTAREQEVERLREAVVESTDSLKAWMHTYASEECEESEVARYKALIAFHNGTLAYLARVFRINRQALAGTKEGG